MGVNFDPLPYDFVNRSVSPLANRSLANAAGSTRLGGFAEEAAGVGFRGDDSDLPSDALFARGT